MLGASFRPDCPDKTARARRKRVLTVPRRSPNSLATSVVVRPSSVRGIGRRGPPAAAALFVRRDIGHRHRSPWPVVVATPLAGSSPGSLGVSRFKLKIGPMIAGGVLSPALAPRPRPLAESPCVGRDFVERVLSSRAKVDGIEIEVGHGCHAVARSLHSFGAFWLTASPLIAGLVEVDCGANVACSCACEGREGSWRG